jgi:hypothetical protein
MRRLTLFPPPGTVETLPEDVLKEATRILAELILAVLERAAEASTHGEDNAHE